MKRSPLVKVVSLLGGLLALWGAPRIWDYLNETFIYHDKLTTVYSRDWANGEYKECSNVNAKTEEPYLQCDDLTLTEKGKVFNVRFYGQTYVAENRFETLHYWKCRKNGYVDPEITCECSADRQRFRSRVGHGSRYPESRCQLFGFWPVGTERVDNRERGFYVEQHT